MCIGVWVRWREPEEERERAELSPRCFVVLTCWEDNEIEMQRKNNLEKFDHLSRKINQPENRTLTRF